MKIKHKITTYINRKSFLPTLYVVMAVVFFGCQNKEDKQQEIKNIEVTKDTLTAKPEALDATAISTKKTDQAPSDLSKIEQLKIKKTATIASREVDDNKSSKSDNVKKDNASSSTLKPLSNTNAEFPGGIDQFHTFFMKEYKKPENVNYWKLNFTLAFAIEKNGSVSFLECLPPVEEPLEKEIIRVLNLCPKWQPGESNGKKVRMQYSVPILLK
jgi:protein TonB